MKNLIFVLLSLFAVGCAASRSGELYKATLYDYDTWAVAAVETGAATGKVASFFFSRPFGTMELTSSIDVGQTPSSIDHYAGFGFVYVANTASGTISVISINKSTGALALVQTITGLTSVTAVRSSTNGYIYAGYASGVQTYTVDTATGMLTAKGSPVSFGGAVQQLKTSYSGRGLYVVIGGTTLYEAGVNLSTGAVTPNNSYGMGTIESIDTGTGSVSTEEYLVAADSTTGNFRMYTSSTSTGFLTYVASTTSAAIKSAGFLSSYGGVAAQNATGGITTYKIATGGAVTVNNTYSTLTDTTVPYMTISGDGGLLLTLGTSGVSLWDLGPASNNTMSLNYRRRQSMSAVGLYAREVTFVSRN